jgi:hypothetical protein
VTQSVDTGGQLQQVQPGNCSKDVYLSEGAVHASQLIQTHLPLALFGPPPHTPPLALTLCYFSCPQDLSTCEQSGRDLAVQVKRRLKTREQGSMGSMAAVTASGPQLAMGRVVGSLCVVTARDGDYATGMLASWVSQVGGGGEEVGQVKQRSSLDYALHMYTCHVLHIRVF